MVLEYHLPWYSISKIVCGGFSIVIETVKQRLVAQAPHEMELFVFFPLIN
jgi:hypothetical protein